MKRIFADFNATDADGSVRLNASGSVDDLRRTGAAPGEVALLSDGELEVEALLRWSASRGHFARPNWATLVSLDEATSATDGSD